MAKGKKPAKGSSVRGSSSGGGWYIKIFGWLGKLINQIGISKFVVVTITVFIFQYASNEQKQSIIDTWVLFKGDTGANASIFLNIFFFLLLIFQQYHYKRVEKLDRERIKELADKKSILQAEKIGKELSTSQT